MSTALRSAGPLKPDIRLAQALSVFEASLSTGDKAMLRSSKSQWYDKTPTVDDVMRLTAEADAQAKRSLGSGRCFGPRLTNIHKTAIGQITSSLSESKIRNAGEELNRWAQLIKDEAKFLLAQTTENEAKENKNHRNWLSRSIKSRSRQQDMDKRLQWLTAFSTFDYETPWKQARKRGSSSFFLDVPGYKQWKQREGPPSLLLSGKMGCGKSVVMANMVDDLSISCSEDVIVYFFCRHDIPDSLSARTVFGSFAAQLSQRHIGTDVMDEIFTNSVPSLMNLNRVLDIIPTMIKRIKSVRLLLDGADECSEEEFDLIKTGLLKLSAECDILSCVSYRDQADGLQAKIWSAGQSAIMSIPDHNPDIAEFIEAELQRLKQSGKLSVGDPSLLITIRETLLQGADGMFLWVALQMDTICAEKTDHLIRRALDNLPKSLSGTFRRILEKSKQEGRCYQEDILKILVGAKRPLTVAEFREALSITPGDISWDPRKVINNIHSTLACCGSIVIIDEDEGTVRLLHQSVVQFLHAAGPDSMEWSFTAHDADTHLGQIIVTYLNYGVFDKRVSTRVIPQVNAGGAAGTILTQTLSPLGTLGRKLSDTVMKRQKPSNRNIGATLFSVPASETTHKDFHFWVYSSENLLSHTSRMSHASSATLRLFRRLLLDHPQYTSWLGNVHPSVESVALDRMTAFQSFSKLPSRSSHLPYQSDMAPNISPQLQWAISHSHFLSFSIGLHDRVGLSTLLSVVRYLEYLVDSGKQLHVASYMCDKLLRITTLFRSDKATNWMIKMHGYSIEQYLELLRSSSWFGYSTFRWAVTRNCFDNLRMAKEPLIEEAMTQQDLQTVMSLLRRRASLAIYKREPPLQIAMRLAHSNAKYLLLATQMLRTVGGSYPFGLDAPDVDGFLTALLQSANPGKAVEAVFRTADQCLIESMLKNEMHLSVHECKLLLRQALLSRSDIQDRVVGFLLMRWPRIIHSDEPAVSHAIQLRDWHSAFEITHFLDTNWNRSALYSFDDLEDGSGVKFVLECNRPCTLKPEDHSLFTVLHADSDNILDCCKLLKSTVEPIRPIRRAIALVERNRFESEASHHGVWDQSLVLSLCQQILSYLVDSDRCSDPRLLTEWGLAAALLSYLGTLLKRFIDPYLDKASWVDMLRLALRIYRSLNILASDMCDRQEKVVDAINVLRYSTVMVTERLLRKYKHCKDDGQLHWSITDDDWSNLEPPMLDSPSESIMGLVLQLYGFERNDSQKSSHLADMPLEWQAFAAGWGVVQLIDNRGGLELSRQPRSRLYPKLDKRKEIEPETVIREWRAASRRS
ncbi:hypothetical protein E8E14_002429 [Neopestalotiopsis sp. 37M]|nr:hypothetical protein E8E14_002429 [Neopestalotiopsis sp. 37M]